MASITILHVEDDPKDAELAAERLRASGLDCTIHRVDTGPDLEAALAASRPDVILSDFALPSFDGLSALRMARRIAPYVPFVFLSGAIGEERATELIREGATDYVLKDRMTRLPRAVERALSEARERAERDWAMAELRRALRDKEALFAEVHHRVRNNFQIVSSLLRLHGEQVHDTEGPALLADLQARVRAMALVHDILYRTERAATLDFEGYARELCGEIDALYGAGSRGITIAITAPPIPLSLSQAVPAGLLLHELVAEALSRSPRSAKVEVRLVPADGTLTIEVQGPNSADRGGEARDGGLGARLMGRLARQLSGELTVDEAAEGGGIRARVTFPVEPTAETHELSAVANALAAARG